MKKNKMRLSFCMGDAVIIVLITMLAVFVGVLFSKTIREEGNMVAVYKNGKKVQEFPLDQNREIFIENGYTNKMVIQDKKAAIIESDCPGEDCVHSGWISGSGRSLVCLPNRVEIRIEGEAEVDFIVR